MLQHIVVWVITRGVITAIALASGKLIRVCAHSQRIHIQSWAQHSANPRSGPDNSWLSCWMAFCFTVLSTTNCLTRDGTPITRWFLCNLWGKFHLKITGQKRMLVEKCMVSADTLEWKSVQLSHLDDVQSNGPLSLLLFSSRKPPLKTWLVCGGQIFTVLVCFPCSKYGTCSPGPWWNGKERWKHCFKSD